MNHRIFIVLSFAIALTIGCEPKSESVERTTNLNRNWSFYLGDLEEGENPALNTDSWRTLNLPHDWSIEGEYNKNNGDWQTGFLPAGIGWYRKSITWQPEWEGKNVSIHFEGVYLNSDVWINGKHLGHRPNGYIGFEYDLTDHLKEGDNLIAVRVDHSRDLTGRWYTGSGIYRHVWLNVKNKVHIPTWGVFFKTPYVSEDSSTYNIAVSIANRSNKNSQLTVKTALKDGSGKSVSEKSTQLNIEKEGSETIEVAGSLTKVNLWSPENPNLYTLESSVYLNGRLMDRYAMNVGFRQLEFGSDFGFRLNGKTMLFKGVCDHHTAGPVGAAVPDDVLRYRLEKLKEMGCNAIRTAHNPFSPTFYRLCDELGLMVMNEFLDGWEKEKARDDYGNYFEEWWERDGTDFIKRDRNHPSVVIWSIGNEVVQATEQTQKKLIDLFHLNDPTRPVTQGGKSPSRDEGSENLQSQLDIAGYNGHGEERGVFENHHADFPDDIIIGTEIPHTYQTRGVYKTKTHWRVRDFPAMWEVAGKRAGKMGDLKQKIFDVPDLTSREVFTDEITTHYYKDGTYYAIDNDAPWAKNLYHQSSYDNAIVRANTRKTWQRVVELPYVIGQFRWGSFDYLGETNNWPSRFANFGVLDVCGIPKDHFYLYKSLWTEEPMVYILPHWTHPGKEGVSIPVVVYTNCSEVELFLNNTSLGTKINDGEQLVWNIPYTEGIIEAVGKKEGAEPVKAVQKTAKAPSKIILNPDRQTISPNGTDIVHIEVQIADNSGTLCPYADIPLEFEVSGPGRILAVDNGDPLDLSMYRSNKRRTFRGKAMLLIESGNQSGEITVTAKGDKLENGSTSIMCLK